MVQKSVFRIDLNAIEGEGDFPCPSCGTVISPDDVSGVNYDTVDVRTKEDGSLKELSIVCKKCRSIIRIQGFEALDELENSSASDITEQE